MALLDTTRDALLKVATSTITGALHRRGLSNMFMQDVNPLRQTQARMVGIAYTMRFIPFRQDKAGAERPQPWPDTGAGDGGVPARARAGRRFAGRSARCLCR